MSHALHYLLTGTGKRPGLTVGTGRTGTHWLGNSRGDHPEVRATIGRGSPAVRPRHPNGTRPGAGAAAVRRSRPILAVAAARSSPGLHLDKSHPNRRQAEKIKATFHAPGQPALSTQAVVLAIDVRLRVADVVDAICRCEAVPSTSLHGVIVGIAYGVPALCIEVSDQVIGHGFKCRDFFASIGADVAEPVRQGRTTRVDALAAQARRYTIGLDLEDLLSHCPFNGSQPDVRH